MKCVKCDGELKATQVAGVEVDQCPKCGGVWFDLGEMEDVLAAEQVENLQAAVARSEADDKKAGFCPRCGGEGHMVPVLNPEKDLFVDTCPVCYGTWLDGREIDLLREQGVLGSARKLFEHLFGTRMEDEETP